MGESGLLLNAVFIDCCSDCILMLGSRKGPCPDSVRGDSYLWMPLTFNGEKKVPFVLGDKFFFPLTASVGN